MEGRGAGAARQASRALVALLALALVTGIAACKADRPGWTFAPPSPAPESAAPDAVTAGAAIPSPTPGQAPAPTPSASASPLVPAPTPSPSATPTAARPPRPGVAGDPVVAVPILYYHRVSAPPRGFGRWSKARREQFLRYDVLPSAFEAQLDWLLANGYTTILPRDLAAHWDTGAPLPERPVIISFDDGTHDWTGTVLPLLRERGMVAQFYVTLQAIPAGGMTWRELRELAAAGNGIGAHGLHHRQLAGLPGKRDAVSEAVMREEVTVPRRRLERRIGIVPDSYSYVGGGHDATLRRLVREAGYTTARSILRGRTQHVDRRYTLRVIRVGSGMDVRDVRAGTLAPGLPRFTRLMRGAGEGS